MAKGQTKAAQSMAQDNYSRNVAQQKQQQDYLWGNLPSATQKASQLSDTATSAYTSFLGGSGAMDPAAYSRDTTQNQSNISTGGYDPAKMNLVQSHIGQNVATGGYDPTEAANIRGGYQTATGTGMGGIDPSQAGKVRDAYGNLISTGGLDEATADAMRRRAASSTASIYSSLGADLARKSTAQGVTAGGETAQMARQASSAAAEATTGAEAQIGQIRQTGKIAGAGGLSQFEQGAGAAQREALAGESSFESGQAAGRRESVGQEAGVAASEAAGRLQATGQQQQLDFGVAQQRIQAAGGLVNLYNSSPGYVNSLVQQIMQSQQIGGTLTTEQAQIMQELSKNPGLFQTIVGDVAALGGAAGGVMKGIAGLGG